MTDKKAAKTAVDMPVKETAAQQLSRRIVGARFLGGAWIAADGSPLTDIEAQAAHRAMDQEQAKARAAALGGES